MIEPSPHSDRRHGGGARLHTSWHLQKGSEGRDVVSPENLLEVDEVLFREKGAGPGRAIIDATHHNGKAVGCGRHPDVGPERTQLAVDFVAHVQRDRADGRRHGHAQRHRHQAQKLAAPAAHDGLADDSG